MPPKARHLSFKNHNRQIKLPFVIYAYIEALQIPEKSKSKKVTHQPCGFAYSLKCSYDDSLSKYQEYCGHDCIKVLWSKLEDETTKIAAKSNSRAEPQSLNAEEKRICDMINKCYFCGEELEGDRCEDFCAFSGRFLGVAHNKCVDSSKGVNFVPVVMHNLSKFGAHFLLDGLSKDQIQKIFFVGRDESAKFGFSRKFSNFDVRFVDSRLFLDEKIEDLEKILTDAKKRRLRTEFKTELMRRKCFFPSFYMDSFDKFSETALPSKEGFFDRLHEGDICDEEYQRCRNIWDSFNCRTITNYFGVYLKSNVFLLEDIFENFRFLCLDKYGLDPTHYYTIAGFAWDSMLRFTRVKLEVLQDYTIINFIKNNIRGGIVQCSKRHAKANNKYCDFDKTKPSTFIVYLDANNLGGWAMSQNLPFSDFRWLSTTEIQEIRGRIPTLPEDTHLGYFFEVDLDYPVELHNHHNDLPFCSQQLQVPPPPTSSYCSAVKPVLNFYPKRKYVIDYRTLKQCLENGLVLKKIYRVLEFRQTKWLEPYITHNTLLRAEAQNPFETKLYKLLNNSVFGKTIEKTTKDRPIYAGFSILELSKKFIYDFHYNQMLSKYKNRIDLLYLDTDGLIYEIRTPDFFKDIKSDPALLNLMDTSNLDPRWKIAKKNKKAVGKMKDECDGKIVREFFGVGAKVYFLDVEGEEIKKAVGMKKYVKERFVSREDYENCVLRGAWVKRTSSETKSEGHRVQSWRVSKTVLSPGDRKRCVLEDGVRTVAWGFCGEV